MHAFQNFKPLNFEENSLSLKKIYTYIYIEYCKLIREVREKAINHRDDLFCVSVDSFLKESFL